MWEGGADFSRSRGVLRQRSFGARDLDQDLPGFDAAANRPFQQVRLVESGQAVTRGTASRLSPSVGSRILRADLDATRHRFRLLRNRHGQYAILTGRIDSGTIHRVRQYKTPIK